ncbi:hypothetical protein [Salsuginibacillus kocurii]|uniref:hypothetical protein n=1 Tax=Salsuginibacillus kocurii TaxID=427078 RepID=UPI00035C6A0E|nr:hypothetical protein [Salsuginibacillus kocurii]
MANALDARSENGKIGLGTNALVWESIIPIWKMKNGEITAIELQPIELGFGRPRYARGWPEPSKNSKIMKHLKELSSAFGTNIIIQEDGTGKVEL